MNRNFERYSRGGILLDLENQKNHYKYLLEPRKSLHINQDSNQKVNLSLNMNNKHEKQLTRKRYQENQRLYKVLCNIQSTKGTIQLMQSKARQQQKTKKKYTLNSQHKILQRKKQIKQDNKRIVNLIGHAKPKIGNLAQWEEHYNKFQKQKKKISKVSQYVFNVQTLITEKDTQLKNFFRQTFDFKHMKVSKDKEKPRKNKTVSKHRKKNTNNKIEKNIEIDGLNQEQLNILKQQGKLDDQKNNYEKQKFQLPEVNKNFQKQKTVPVQNNKAKNI